MSEQGKPGFLVVSRCVGQSIVVGDNVTITVQEIRTGQVRIGIQAPRSVPVDRLEVRDRKQAGVASHA
jgi:carbon storage regulator